MNLKKHLFYENFECISVVGTVARFLFIVFIYMTISCLGHAQKTQLKFENISVEDGLSSYFVNCIHQDSRGFLWVGTKDGLNRYDGFSFVKYHSNSIDDRSISHNYVNAICEDPSMNGIWVGTNRGLSYFDFRSEQFTSFYNDRKDSTTISSNNISSISVCKQGGLWIGTRNGLNRIFPHFDLKSRKVDVEKSRFIRYNKIGDKNGILSGNSINCIYSDRNGNLWIAYQAGELDQLMIDESGVNIFPHENYNGGSAFDMVEDNSGAIWIVSSGAGLVKYDPKNKTFFNCLSENRINAICKGSRDVLWLGTYNNGLIKISSPKNVRGLRIDTTVFKRYKNNPKDLSTITDNWLRCLYVDQSGVLWAGTRRNGIIKISFEKDYFDYHSYDKSNEIIADLQEVNTIIETRDKLIWVGTASGLFSFNQETKEIKKHKKELEGKQVSPVSVFSLCEDRFGNLWMGTFGAGLYRYDRQTEKYSHFYQGKGNNLSSNEITSVISLKSGDLLLGTSKGGIDLIKVDELKRDNPVISPFLPGTLPKHDKFTSRRKVVFEDSKGIIWITTVLNGLYKYNPYDQTLKHYPYDEKNPHSISDNHIASICEGNDGTIWIATDKGLDSFDVDKEIFTKYYTDEGLPDNTVIGVQTDKNGNVWALTRKWVSRLNPASGEIKNFNYYHRVVTGLFTPKRICKTSDGKLFVGTQRKGFFSFDPDSIVSYPYQPPIVLTDFKVSGVSIQIGDKRGSTILSESINHAKEIRLAHDQNNISFGFSALSYINQEDNQYACKLEGTQEAWLYLNKNQRSINYFNLSPGSYTFKVKAANYDGVWNDSFTSVNIDILPPWWRTQWAYFIYCVLFLLLLFTSYHYSSVWIRLKNKLELEKLEKVKMAELNQLKLRFFTNISHEFRTPLSLIIGPLENMLADGNINRKTSRYLKLMHGNAIRLLRLINQLMDFRKIENNEMQLLAEPSDIIKFTKRIAYLFNELAKQKNIDFCVESQLNSLEVYFDHDKLDKVLYNLLSNAFKFTPDGGQICIEIARRNDCVYIVVSDNGKGIETQDIGKVFDRFYQVEQQQTGTGIGLSLCKKLVQLHQGEISVKSGLGQGSSFTVKLPLGKVHLKESEIVYSTKKESIDKPIALLEEDVQPEKERISKNLPLVLLVEDNITLRNFIKDSVEFHFRVIEADNGRTALKLAKQQQPALIISDVMMPEMDGIEFCKTVKTDDELSHIPIILLTALSSVEDVFTGYKSGADDYIPKPFNPQLLILRSTNLIEKGKKLRKRFQKEIQLQPKDITIASADEKLLEKIMKVIEKHMGNPDFTVEKMGVEIGISRVHLNRKIKALTDQTAVDFIRTIRMKQAAKLLKRKKLNISEIAYAVGFSNPISFARSFKKQFGCAPSNFVEES